MEDDKRGQEDIQKDNSETNSGDNAKSPQEEVFEKSIDQKDGSSRKDEDNAIPPTLEEDKKTEHKADEGQGESHLRSAVEEVKHHRPEPKMFDTSGQDTNE